MDLIDEPKFLAIHKKHEESVFGLWRSRNTDSWAKFGINRKSTKIIPKFDETLNWRHTLRMAQPISSTLPTCHLLYKKDLNINDLPSELFSKIISYLSPRNIPRLLGVCRQWQTRMKTSKTVIKPLQTMISQEIQKKKEIEITKLKHCEEKLIEHRAEHADFSFFGPTQLNSEIDRLKSKIQSIETTSLLEHDLTVQFQKYRTVDLESAEVLSISAKTKFYSCLCTSYTIVPFLLCVGMCIGGVIVVIVIFSTKH